MGLIHVWHLSPAPPVPELIRFPSLYMSWWIKNGVLNTNELLQDTFRQGSGKPVLKGRTRAFHPPRARRDPWWRAVYLVGQKTWLCCCTLTTAASSNGPITAISTASRAVSAVSHAWLVTCRPNPGWHADIIWDESRLCSAFRMYGHGMPLLSFFARLHNSLPWHKNISNKNTEEATHPSRGGGKSRMEPAEFQLSFRSLHCLACLSVSTATNGNEDSVETQPWHVGMVICPSINDEPPIEVCPGGIYYSQLTQKKKNMWGRRPLLVSLHYFRLSWQNPAHDYSKENDEVCHKNLKIWPAEKGGNGDKCNTVSCPRVIRVWINEGIYDNHSKNKAEVRQTPARQQSQLKLCLLNVWNFKNK